ELVSAHDPELLGTGRRVLLGTPKLTGMDGISNVSRQVVDVIVGGNQNHPDLRIWSLADDVCFYRSIPIDGFSNEKLKLCGRALAHTFATAENLTVFILHLH